MSKTEQDIQALIDAERKRLRGEAVETNSLQHQGPSSTEQQVADPQMAQMIAEERSKLMVEDERARLQPAEDKAGFFESTGDYLALSLKTTLGMADYQDQARIALTGAGIIQTAILEPAQAITQIPGLFAAKEIMTDRWAEYLSRASKGAFSESEKFAMSMGLDAREVGEYNSIGRFIGFTAPMIASEGAASFLMRDPSKVLRFVEVGNLVRDLSAGAIYGGVLKPGDDVGSRLNHLLNESAAFGVGRLVLSGLAFPFNGWKLQRYVDLQARDRIKELLTRMANGEEIVFQIGDDLALQIISEEGFILGSARAQELIRTHTDERALIAGILDAQTGQAEAGIVRNIGKSWSDVQEILGKFKEEFPALKFDAIKADEGYHVYFGLKGLSNAQKSHFKQFGRYPGQRVEKAGASYEYVRQAKKGYITVKTSNGKVVNIKDTDITDTFGIVEETNNTALQDLYEAFRSDLPRIQKDLQITSRAGMTEDQLILAVKNGTLKVIATERRPMDIGFAVTYPEEIGAITDPQAFYQTVMENGMSFASDLPGGRITSFDEMVELWARGRGLEGKDMPTLKSYFAQKARTEFWNDVPAEDRLIFEKIQTQFQELVESGAVPFDALAHNKGFSTFREGGKVILRDINSGSKLTFTNEQVARDAITKIIRPEKDMLGGFGAPPFGSTGISAMTGGFDPTDGFFSMDGSSIAKDLLQDMPLFSSFRNMRDTFIKIEDVTGVRTFTSVFDKLDEGLTKMRNEVEPWAKEVENVWKGLSKKDTRQVVEFWRSIEGEDLSIPSMMQRAQRAGLSSRQITTLRKSHEIFDALHAISGLPKAQYIPFYFSRVQPYALSRGGSVGDSFWKGFNIPQEFSWWAESTRTGSLSQVEMNPEIVMHKYIRGLMFRKHVQETYNSALTLTKVATTPKLGDLPPAVQSAILQKRPGVDARTPILGQHVRSVLAEYLNIVRGAPTSSQETARRFFKNFMGHLNVKVDDKVLDEYTSIALQNMYGAAMALRPALTARNAVQNIWLQYTRLGGKWGGTSMERALTREGYQEVFDALAIRNTSAGIPMGDAILDDFMSSNPIEGSGIMGSAIAGTMRMFMRTGRASGKLARKWLVPYSSTDDMNRAWSYWWQKLHTDEWLTKYESSSISWDKFLEEGLPMFHPVVKREFAQRYHKFGREQALQWIGKLGSDDTNFIYGVGAQPAWMQKPWGRFVGMFGTWPIWAMENYLRRPPLGTKTQMAAFWARNLALVGAFANMTMQSGIDLWNWIAPNSFMSWTGGPAIDDMIQFKQVMDAPIDQKVSALKILGKRVGSLALPGQVFLTYDVKRSLEAPDAMQAGLRLMLGKPVDDPEWPLQFYSNDYNGDPILPHTQDTLLKMKPAWIPPPKPVGR